MKTTVTLACVLSAILSTPTWANTLIVNGASCTLQNAITAANTDTSIGGCLSGSGPDTIKLTTDITLDTVDNDADGPNGLPSVTTELTLSGQGHVLSRSYATGTPQFRILHVGVTGDLTINNIKLENGAVEENYGGGIINHGKLKVKSSEIVRNNASGGAGVGNIKGKVSIVNSRLMNNTSDLYGGGAFNLGGTMTVDKSTVFDNLANDSGGGFANSGDLIISNSTISANMADQGAGVYADTFFAPSSNIRLTNSTVSGNIARYGGGLFLPAPGNAVLVNTTIFSNVAYRSMGGFWGGDVSVSLQDTIIANSVNHCTFCEHEDEIDCFVFPGLVVAVGENLVEHDDNCAASSFPEGTDPKLAGLAMKGGPTPTHVPLADSPVINTTTCVVPTDQRGATRPKFAGFCDVGAVEFGFIDVAAR